MKTTALIISLILILSESVQAQIDYNTQVQPVFNSFCKSCHGGTSGVTVDSYHNTMASIGTQYMQAIVTPGDKGDSPIWDKINSTSPAIGNKMPPQGLMSEENRNIIGQWIDEGAAETATGLEQPGISPVQFELAACYPNPFNPNTTVRFTLPISAIVQ
jgi:hypothetical protein